MNTSSCRRALPGSIHLASAALCLTLFSGSAIADDKPRADTGKPAAEAAKKERLLSLVVLFHEPRELDEHTVGNLVSKALGVKHSHDETKGSFVVAKPDRKSTRLNSSHG